MLSTHTLLMQLFITINYTVNNISFDNFINCNTVQCCLVSSFWCGLCLNPCFFFYNVQTVIAFACGPCFWWCVLYKNHGNYQACDVNFCKGTLIFYLNVLCHVFKPDPNLNIILLFIFYVIWSLHLVVINIMVQQ